VAAGVLAAGAAALAWRTHRDLRQARDGWRAACAAVAALSAAQTVRPESSQAGVEPERTV
jgi:hypothetical protein